MPHKSEFKEKILYSRSLDLLIEWGKTHLLQKDKNICQLEREWESVPERIGLLYSGLECLEEKIEQVLNRLRSPVTLDLNLDQAETIQSDLKILDQVIFLVESIEFFPDAADFPEDFQNSIEETLHQIFMEDWMRLIPLNSWRREMLEKIPSESHYLFTWYKEWSELPEEVFDTLSAHWGDFISLEMNMEKATLNLLTNALSYDRELLNQICQDAHLFQLASHAIKEDSELSRISSLGQKKEINIYLFLQMIKKTTFQPLSFKFIPVMAMLCLAIFLSIYNFYDASRIVYHAPQKKEVVRKEINPQKIPSEKQAPSSEPISEKEQVHSILSIELEPLKEAIEATRPPVDPFHPFIRWEKPAEKSILPKTPYQQEAMLPENVDLNQLELVAIIRSEYGNKALLQDGSGKGYIVTKGTSIGIHGARVTEILKEKIIVEEKIEDQQGRMIFHTREFRLGREKE